MLTVEVDIARLYDNVRAVKAKTDAGIWAVVKANAYGHGARETAHAVKALVHGFAVADEREALALVSAGIRQDILVMGTAPPKRLSLPKNIILTVADREGVLAARGHAARVALKLNTGMNRLGARTEDAAGLYQCAIDAGLSTDSAFTHFYAGADETQCAIQHGRFLEATQAFYKKLPLHCCASNALTLPKAFHHDFIRPGLAMYGCGYQGVRPAMRVYADALQLNRVARGGHIGYGTFRASHALTAVTFRAGYGDGYPRKKPGERREVSIGGLKCPVLGQVCMDMSMADVSGVGLPGDGRVYLLDEVVTADELAAKMKTITYEVLTMINDRAERVYVHG
ncbi:MAG: alanine racemase [Clostridiales bacterium]|nr:alanine racemase [Clostridiales bacterium]